MKKVLPSTALAPTPVSGHKLLRQLLVFQLKLIIDGMKDFVLAPVSIVAGIFGLFFSKDPAAPLRLVLRMGRSFDDYVDLYSGLEDMEGTGQSKGLDQALARVEQTVLKPEPKVSR